MGHNPFEQIVKIFPRVDVTVLAGFDKAHI